ncbi:MAG: hypothetical protein DSY90_00090 [Deltaproteobacteria bacterium]|nr:MAG: hypothetical protein DSY90_00090 [Deltaproteobacteria bacterium]
MNMTKPLKILSVLFVALLASVPLAGAGIYFESTQVSQGVPGQTDGPQTVRNYLTEHASRAETADRIIITNYDTGVMYQIDPQAKTYREINLAGMGMPKMEAKESEALQGMLKKMMGRLTVVPTGETKEIAGYPCRKYLVKIMMMHSEYWVSKKVPGYAELMTIGKKVAGLFNRNPMLKQMNIAAMMTDLDGFPVKTVTSMMNGQTTTTLTKIEQKALAENLFQIPAGYQKK